MPQVFLQPHTQVKNGNVLKFFKDYWFLLIFIVTVAFGWSEMRAQIQANASIITKHEEVISDNRTRINETQLEAAVAKQKIEALEMNLNEIKTDIKTIIRTLK